MGTPPGRAHTRFPQSNSSISPLQAASEARRQFLPTERCRTHFILCKINVV